MASTGNPVGARQLGGWDNGDGTKTTAGVPAIAGVSVIASITGAAAATAVATMPAVAGKTNYVTGLIITSSNPASTVVGQVTVTGLQGGTLTLQFTESATLGGNLQVFFTCAQPAQAVNAPVVLTVPAIASGGVVSASLLGFVV